MLTEQATPQMIQEWKQIFEQYKGKLKSNRKTGQEIVDYLLSKYSLIPVNDDRAKQVVSLNVLENEPLKEKLPDGTEPDPVAFYWNDDGKKVFIGVDLSSGYFLVEGSAELHDELCAFQGLDSYDLENFYCVAQYIICLQKFNRFDVILGDE
jgi:hypothetical protein